MSQMKRLLENQSGSKVNLRTQPENEMGFNVHMRTQPQTDDEASLNASSLWFGNNATDSQEHQRVNDDRESANPEDNQPTLLNKARILAAKH